MRHICILHVLQTPKPLRLLPKSREVHPLQEKRRKSVEVPPSEQGAQISSFGAPQILGTRWVRCSSPASSPRMLLSWAGEAFGQVEALLVDEDLRQAGHLS